ncbi:two-component regulator propeller domain-containing protein [Winogradskyella sp. A3E31]|uniref:two-component regulator propeller domain-containing protein n=1 Tax=Winogradskyella sp. A3E31 TaxID=3349637 RepID=UPI00398A7124
MFNSITVSLSIKFRNIWTLLLVLVLMVPLSYSQNLNENFTATTSSQFSFNTLSVDEGLSQNSVVSIAQDSIGYLWFATQDGLNKYNGKEYVYFPKHFDDITRPTYSKLGNIYVDRHGSIWIITAGGQLEKYNQKTATYEVVKNINNANSIFQDSNDTYYISTSTNNIYSFQPNKVDTLNIQLPDNSPSIQQFIELDKKVIGISNTTIFEIRNKHLFEIASERNDLHFSSAELDQSDNLWIATHGQGIWLFDKYKNIIKQAVESPFNQIPQTLNIQDLFFDSQNRLWIATYGQGLWLLDLNTKTKIHFLPDKHNPNSISYRDILCIYEDYNNTIWFGTDGGGVSYFDEHLFKFNVITNNQVAEGININVIRSITVDDNDNIWLGTSGKGLTKYNPNKNSFVTYTVENSGLASNRIMSLKYIDDTLWVGHQGFGLQIIDEKGFKDFNINSNPALDALTIWHIFKDSQNRLWLGTRNNGLIQFDAEKGVINQYNSTTEQSLTSDNIRVIEEGPNNSLFVGADDGGLNIVDTATGKVEIVSNIPYKIKSLFFDGDKMLWVGTNGNGLLEYNLLSKKTKLFNTENGLANNVIYGILPDSNGNLWLSSNRGLSKFNPQSEDITNYSNYDGLQASEFNTGAYFKDKNGTLYFGGVEGLNWFKPKNLTLNTSVPKTVLTRFEIFTKEQPLTQGQSLRYNDNTVTFTFAGLHYSQPDRNQYVYKLENHDNTWQQAGNSNTAHYTNLPSGDYTFKVKSSNYDGVWNDQPAEFSFTIAKPWYLTNYAISVYTILLILLVYIVIHYFKTRWKLKMELALEHSEREKLEQLSDFKSKLYTNISHEIRTPLTLANGPINNQLNLEGIPNNYKKDLTLIKKNFERLMNLVDQMSDLALVDTGQLKIQVAKGNLSKLLKQLIEAFKYRARQKNIDIESKINGLDLAWFDQDIIEKILSNLLNNAIKYSPENSKIVFKANNIDGQAVLTVINKNLNVSKTELNKVFNRFYQDNHQSEGMGVGLALVKELIDLNRGNIVVNNLNEHSIQFTASLPIEESSYRQDEKIETISIEDGHEDLTLNEDKSSLKTILVVEDDTEIKNLLVSILSKYYNVKTATNGMEGIKIAEKILPNVIISDIMMPIMDGTTFCQKLRANPLTSHIPFIMLTAKVGKQAEIEGFQSGADAYVTKPFDPKVLLSRLNAILKNHEILEKYYGDILSITPNIEFSNSENRFLKRLKEVLDDKLTDPELTAERLAQLMSISRTNLHRKLKSITGKSTTEYLRYQRLKLAEGLLKRSDDNINEIAYKIGFNSPSYFLRCFKKKYNCTPEEYRKTA